MQTLITRTISAIVYVVIFLSAILLSEKTYIGLLLIFAGVCLWEFSKIILLKNVTSYFLLPLVLFYCKEYAPKQIILILLIITLLASIRLVFHLYSKEKVYPSTFIGKLDLCLRYIILPFTFLILLPFIDGVYQPNLIIFIIVLIWINDSFAYLVGRKIGKTKLFERVSPKKTVEGFLGGMVFAIIAGVIIGIYSNILALHNWIIIAIIVSAFGTIGDLVESKFKRQANVKDSGTIMPGHGGLLDRLDSLFFLAPFVYLYVHFLM